MCVAADMDAECNVSMSQSQPCPSRGAMGPPGERCRPFRNLNRQSTLPVQ